MKKLAATILILTLILTLAGCSFHSGNGNSNKETIDLDGLVLVDNEYCTITALELISSNGESGNAINLELINKSSQTKMAFASSQLSVNGLSTIPYFYAELDSEKKSTEKLEFANIKECAFDRMTDITFDLAVYNADDYSEDYYVDEVFHIYPYGEDQVEKFVYEPKPSDFVLADDDNITLSIIGLEQDADGDYSLKTFLCNKTNQQFTIENEDFSVNDVSILGLLFEVLDGGEAVFSDTFIYKDELDASGINEIKKIKMDLVIRNYENYTSPLLEGILELTLENNKITDAQFYRAGENWSRPSDSAEEANDEHKEVALKTIQIGEAFVNSNGVKVTLLDQEFTDNLFPKETVEGGTYYTVEGQENKTLYVLHMKIENTSDCLQSTSFIGVDNDMNYDGAPIFLTMLREENGALESADFTDFLDPGESREYYLFAALPFDEPDRTKELTVTLAKEYRLNVQ